jgi:hypothetical protein
MVEATKDIKGMLNHSMEEAAKDIKGMLNYSMVEAANDVKGMLNHSMVEAAKEGKGITEPLHGASCKGHKGNAESLRGASCKGRKGNAKSLHGASCNGQAVPPDQLCVSSSRELVTFELNQTFIAQISKVEPSKISLRNLYVILQKQNYIPCIKSCCSKWITRTLRNHNKCFEGNHHVRAPYCFHCGNELGTDVYRNFY